MNNLNVFTESRTGQFLDNIGALEYCQIAWSKSLGASAKSYMWVEKNTPYYWSAAVEVTKPYLELTKDIALIVGNQACQLYSNVRDYAVDKWPVVYSTVDHYIPGFLNSVGTYSVTAWNAVKSFSSYYCEVTSTYLMTKVFV